MSDALARRRIREDFDSTLWVEAAAGTGKTSELVRRIVGLVASGRGRLSGVAAVTFTEKAAGELKLRLRGELEAARRDPVTSQEVRERLDRAVRELETARVGTIHALCADILRERPIEAGVDPLFEVMGDDEAGRCFDSAFGPWLEARLEDPPEGVRRMLRREPDFEGRGPRLQLRQTGLDVSDRRDFDGPWTRPPFDRAAAIDALIAVIAEFGAYADQAAENDHLAKASAVARAWVEDLRRRERTRGRDYDGIEVDLRRLRRWEWKRTGRGAAYGPGVPRAEVIDARDRAERLLAAVSGACDADLAACLRADLTSLVEAHQAAKLRAGRLDYVDLLLQARELLVRDGGVRAELQRRFTHLFVDEFQDTDPLQADVVLLLAADDAACANPGEVRVAPGKLFVVGDPKQAIYRFRRADVACYEALKVRLLATGAELLHLTTSFRSDPRIQQAVNAAFEPRMRGDGQASYVALEPFRPPSAERPAVIALPVPHPYGSSRQASGDRIDASLAEAVANFIRWVLDESGWQVTEADKPAAPVQSRHICLLFRSTVHFRKDLLREFTRPLEARGIPHVLVGGRAFHGRDEVLAVRNALQAVEWPDDTLSVYATLRGPLFGLPDDALLLWRDRFGPPNPLRRPEPDPADPARDDLVSVRDALDVLASARRGRNHRPIARTLGQILDATRAHAGFAAAASGEQVLANVLRIGQLARRFESTGPTSFRAFVDWLDEAAARGDSPDAPVVEEGTEGVRLMTVHKAKGLEFPIVVLADMSTAHTRKDPSRYIDPARRIWAMPLAGCVPADLREHGDEVLADDRREADRLTYVAATRARDVLVVPVIGDQKRDGWLNPLHPAIHPRPGTHRNPRPAPGCPPFGPHTLLDGDRHAGEDEVRPGLHVPEAGDHEVVWWEALDHEEPWVGGLRRQTLLEADGPDDGRARYEGWAARHAETLRAGAVPTLDVFIATEGAWSGRPVPVEASGVDRVGRPAGTRFGSLVHATLAVVPFDADTQVIARAVALQARILGAPAPERAAAEVAVATALQHPLMLRAATSPDCRREVAVAWRTPEGRLIEGVADLVFLDGPAWVVVDYKTDADLGSRRRVYEAQVTAYVEGVRAATGAEVTAVLFAV